MNHTPLAKPRHVALVSLASLALLGAACVAQTSPAPRNSQGGNSPAPTITGEEPAVSDSIAVLDLSNQRMTKFPMYVLDLAELQELNLSYNKLEGAIPAEIRHLANLKKLDLSHNRMTGLPAELGQLSELEELDVSYNQLTGLPYELGNLKNLKRFVLTGNSFAEQDLQVILKGNPDLEVVR